MSSLLSAGATAALSRLRLDEARLQSSSRRPSRREAATIAAETRRDAPLPRRERGRWRARLGRVASAVGAGASSAGRLRLGLDRLRPAPALALAGGLAEPRRSRAEHQLRLGASRMQRAAGPPGSRRDCLWRGGGSCRRRGSLQQRSRASGPRRLAGGASAARGRCRHLGGCDALPARSGRDRLTISEHERIASSFLDHVSARRIAVRVDERPADPAGAPRGLRAAPCAGRR